MIESPWMLDLEVRLFSTKTTKYIFSHSNADSGVNIHPLYYIGSLSMRFTHVQSAPMVHFGLQSGTWETQADNRVMQVHKVEFELKL